MNEAIVAQQKEIERLTQELEEARDFARKIYNEARIVSCAYCGQAYPQSTPASGSEVLTEHIKVCEKHPMRQLEKTVDSLSDGLMSIYSGSMTVEGGYPHFVACSAGRSKPLGSPGCIALRNKKQ
jgi:hypothetical protein